MKYNLHRHLPHGSEGQVDTWTDIGTDVHTLDKYISFMHSEFQLIQIRNNLLE